MDSKTATNDYKAFIKSIDDLSNTSIKEVKSSRLDTLLSVKNIKECTIEITDICPFNCNHCYLPKTNHEYMKLDNFN